MTNEERINNACDELTALAQYWRNDWSGFDGRTLRRQLNLIVGILKDGKESTEFQEMLKEQEQGY